LDEEQKKTAVRNHDGGMAGSKYMETMRTPTFRVKDLSAVAASANPSIDLRPSGPNGTTKMPQFRVKDPNAVAASAKSPVDLKQAKPLETMKTPQFRVKDPNAVAASANPPVYLKAQKAEEKTPTPDFKAKDPNGVAAPAYPPLPLSTQIQTQQDDDEYDPFNPSRYVVPTPLPSKRASRSITPPMQRPQTPPSVTEAAAPLGLAAASTTIPFSTPSEPSLPIHETAQQKPQMLSEAMASAEPAAPALTPAPISNPLSPAVASAEDAGQITPKNSPSSLILGGENVSTRSNCASPTTPTFTAAKLPNFIKT